MKIQVKTFNGLELTMDIDIYVEYGKKDTTLLPWVYNSIKSKVKENFNEDIDFRIISKSLAILKDKNIEIVWEDFIKKISEFIIRDDIDYEIKDSSLKRAFELYENRDRKAKEVFKLINQENLSQFEKKEYRLLEFLLSDEKDKIFHEYKEYFKNDPIRLRRVYFEYIKYMQDIRDEKIPKEIIKEFEEKFSLNDMSDEEKSRFFYLKARGLYYRGEFIQALRYFIKAKEYVGKNEKLLGDIYNSSANIFTDNFYFDEALNLANKALEIREKLALEEIEKDTLSLIGGIYFKKNNLNKALKYFKQVNRDDARVYNYLAKTAILRGYFKKANEYIQKSEILEEDKKGFLKYVKFLYLFKQNRFDELKELFIQEMVLPEKREGLDKIVIGGIYSLMAEAEFLNNNNIEAFKFLYSAIENLDKDNYILESFVVSLYPYKYEIDKKEIQKFEDYIKEFNVKEKFLDYIEKHTKTLPLLAKKFGVDINSNNLEEFAKLALDKDKIIFSKYNLF
jgi:tetratricopeptide (TPR) repeat protein